ncbi:unnamed protein product [Protopolystoma xenopodis]|uniref:Uncharacterized protein n=1 Tax=Protopolystoma xenopodis TaxID=117903 RepID=A0A3S5AGR2_9PLAT|nr:unnamed protein product [Protopolystoma xenopodis]
MTGDFGRLDCLLGSSSSVVARPTGQPGPICTRPASPSGHHRRLGVFVEEEAVASFQFRPLAASEAGSRPSEEPIPPAARLLLLGSNGGASGAKVGRTEVSEAPPRIGSRQTVLGRIGCSSSVRGLNRSHSETGSSSIPLATGHFAAAESALTLPHSPPLAIDGLADEPLIAGNPILMTLPPTDAISPVPPVRTTSLQRSPSPSLLSTDASAVDYGGPEVGDSPDSVDAADDKASHSRPESVSPLGYGETMPLTK